MWDGQDSMSEAMFSDQTDEAYQKEAVEIPGAISLPETSLVASDVGVELMSGAGGSTLASPQPPPAELMGMVLDGLETVEYPTGSGQIWTRFSPDDDWQMKP